MKTYKQIIEDHKLPIIVASDERLIDPAYHCELLAALYRLGISRREFPEMFTIEIARCDHPILVPTFYEVPDIDTLFNNDPDFRSISNILNGKIPRDLERLRIMDLFLRIHKKRHTLA